MKIKDLRISKEKLYSKSFLQRLQSTRWETLVNESRRDGSRSISIYISDEEEENSISLARSMSELMNERVMALPPLQEFFRKKQKWLVLSVSIDRLFIVSKNKSLRYRPKEVTFVQWCSYNNDVSFIMSRVRITVSTSFIRRRWKAL